MIRYLVAGFRLRQLVVVVFLFGSAPAFAMPEFLQMFRNDPFRSSAFDGCNTCHVSREGGGARNAFGQAFENAGERITPMLRAQFPDRFTYRISRVSDTLTIHFSDPENKEIVVETAGVKNVVDVQGRTVNNIPATLVSTPAAVPSPTPSPSQPTAQPTEVRTDPYAHEGVFFGPNVVNLPDGKPQKAGGWDFFVAHRFLQDIKAAGPAGLFGFDSSAVVSYGVRAGITDRLSVGVLRSNYFKVISLDSAFQVSRQSTKTPVTLQLRGGIDGKQNFGLYSKENNPNPRQYSPFIQFVATRTFKDRVSVTAIPIFAFHTRDETLQFPGFTFGAEHSNTVSLGLGTGIRFLPSVSLVGEYIPRLWGYRGEFTDYPGVSVGLQKSTFRHTFELVVSRQQVLTPVEVAFQGEKTFRLGFNIYRKLR